MKNKILLVLMAASLLLSGCKDFLDAVPEKDIQTIQSIFEKRDTADEWITGAYMALSSGWFTSMSLNPAVLGADEFVGGTFARNSNSASVYLHGLQIADGRQMSQSPYLDLWYDNGPYYYIRYCNTFLDNIHSVYNMTDTEKAQWAAEVRVLKAYLYFEMVRRYGPIVLVPQNIGVEASIEEMRVPRSHVDTCFKRIVELIDESLPSMLASMEKTSDRRGFFSKESALALKARVLLYHASPLFNGNEFYKDFKNRDGSPMFNTEYDLERWRIAAEAADEAVQYCHDMGYKLSQGAAGTTTLLKQIKDLENAVWPLNFISDEVIFMTKSGAASYSNLILPAIDQNSIYSAHRNVSVKGCLGASMKMVEMFYTDKGLPIEEDNSWNYSGRYTMGVESNTDYSNVVVLEEEVLSLHLKREPRFYAYVAADGTYWQRGQGTDYNLMVRAYKNAPFGTGEDIIDSRVGQNLTGYWVKKFTHSDVETKTYYITSLGTIAYPMIRLAELYLMQAEAWNEYEGPNGAHKTTIYEAMNKIRARAGVPDLETSWSYAKNPGKLTTQAGMREIIQRETNIEFMFEGHRFWNLRRWKKAHEELNEKPKGWNIIGENAREFFNNFEGPVVVWDKAEFRSPRDYLFPIKAEEVMIAGYTQNPGW